MIFYKDVKVIQEGKHNLSKNSARITRFPFEGIKKKILTCLYTKPQNAFKVDPRPKHKCWKHNERNQTQKITYCMISFMWNSKQKYMSETRWVEPKVRVGIDRKGRKLLGVGNWSILNLIVVVIFTIVYIYQDSLNWILNNTLNKAEIIIQSCGFKLPLKD